MAIQQLSEDQIREWSIEQKDRWWLQNVFRGDMPQLTLRAALTGFILGGLLSATNLYVGAKTGWSLGVGITSVILAFAFFKVLQQFGVREFTILENNAMQSIATSAGYMTAPLISSLTAYMIVNGQLLPWWQILTWNVVISILGVLFAFPMKRRFINDEQHPFPEGQAAGFVMDTLHDSDASVGLFKARVLACAAGGAALLKFLQAESIQTFLQVSGATLKAGGDLKEAALKKLIFLPEDLAHLFGGQGWTFRGHKLTSLTMNPVLDLSMIGAGGLMGIRAGTSLLIGAVINYMILAPWMIDIGQITANAAGVIGRREVMLWSLWPGVSAMVIASFAAFFSKPAIILSSFKGLFGQRPGEDVLKDIEFPLWVSLTGIPVMSLISAWMAWAYFGVPVWATLVGLPLTFVLSLVASNSTALTGTTPVGATSKITQLFYGLVRPGDIHSNLATAGITAEVVGNSANLLMDIKPGYMLGAKPRQQAIGHIIGIFSGGIASTFLFFALFTKGVDASSAESIAKIQSEQFPMPAVSIWMGVAKVLTEGLSKLPSSVVTAVVVAGAAALVLELLRLATRNRMPLSPVAMGLAFVIDFHTSVCMFLGAFAFWALGAGRLSEEQGKGNLWVENHEPICAGIIAGASLMGIADLLVSVFLLP